MSSLNVLHLESNSKIKINFDGGDLSSDSGLFLIKEFAHKVGFHKLIKKCLKLMTQLIDFIRTMKIYAK